MYKTVQFQPLIQGNSTALIIEDDRMVSTLLKSYLEKSGFTVYQVHHGENPSQAVKSCRPDVIILDSHASDASSHEVCQSLRQGYDGPMMMLTTKDSEEDQIAAFYAGVDDYLVKPVSPAILKIRAESLIRRTKVAAQGNYRKVLQVGNLNIDISSHQCSVNDLPVKLSSFEFKLLHLLVESVGQVLSRDHIYNVLLKRDYNGTERTVDVRMAKLREKLTKAGLEQVKIETVWGQGYVLNEIKLHVLNSAMANSI